MKVARLYGYGDIRIEEEPIPKIARKEALIKTKACGICSGDVMKWYIEKKAPLVLGHEPTGEIVEVGNAVHNFKPGDPVFVHHHVPCLSCKYCNRGDYVQCETWQESRIIPGGISEYIAIPEINLNNDTLKLPENVSFEEATLIEPTACVIKSLKRSGIIQGDTVLVIGLGVMGLLHIILARKFGAAAIIGADFIDFRLRMARQLGADHIIDVKNNDLSSEVKKLTNGDFAQTVIVGPNNAESMTQGLSCVSPGGTVLFFTPAKPGETITIVPNELYFQDITIVTSYSCGPKDTADALKHIERGDIAAENLITHRFSIDETEKAFELTARARESLKCIIVLD